MSTCQPHRPRVRYDDGDFESHVPRERVHAVTIELTDAFHVYSVGRHPLLLLWRTDAFHVYSVGRHPLLLLWRPALLRRVSCRCGITRRCYFTRGTLRLLRLATWSRPT